MLMTRFEAFENLTATESRTKTRGSNMAKVDTALKAYWAGITAADVRQEIRLLNELSTACLGWLKTKKDKSEFKTNFFGMKTNYFNTLFLKRRTAITMYAHHHRRNLAIHRQLQRPLQADPREPA